MTSRQPRGLIATAAGPGRNFEYDSANRMVASTYATYTLDGVHNRIAVEGSVAAGGQLGDYTMLDEYSFEDDYSANQYSTLRSNPNLRSNGLHGRSAVRWEKVQAVDVGR